MACTHLCSDINERFHGRRVLRMLIIIDRCGGEHFQLHGLSTQPAANAMSDRYFSFKQSMSLKML